MSLRHRMILSMLSVVAISGGVSAFIGGYLLWRNLGLQAENRVRQDLNAARQFYDQRRDEIGAVLTYPARGERLSRAVAEKDTDYLAVRLGAIHKSVGLDALWVTDETGRVIYRAHQPAASGDSLADDHLIDLVLKGEDAVSGTILVPIGVLEEEEPSLAGRARVQFLDTPKAKPSARTELESGMMLCSAAAVRGPDGKLVGVLRAGVLLSRNYGLVDQVQNTVFGDERYRGKLLGTAPIFQDDVRISTNVQREDGSRAIGTRVSAEVYDHVLRQGKTWVGPAWVVNAWYISAYEPIREMDGKAIGMLYVGVLAQKFGDITLGTFALFALVTFGGLLVAGVVGWKLADSIARPVGNLASASAAIARGDFSQALRVESADEIGALTRAFNMMAGSLKERD